MTIVIIIIIDNDNTFTTTATTNNNCNDNDNKSDSKSNNKNNRIIIKIIGFYNREAIKTNSNMVINISRYYAILGFFLDVLMLQGWGLCLHNKINTMNKDGMTG